MAALQNYSQGPDSERHSISDRTVNTGTHLKVVTNEKGEAVGEVLTIIC